MDKDNNTNSYGDVLQGNLKITKAELRKNIEERAEAKIIEPTNADLLIKLIENADSVNEAISIAQLGTMYKRTGFHYDVRLEKMGNDIKYFKRNEQLSFTDNSDGPVNKLIIGDNYDALQNLLIQYREQIDVIYIDPPYGKDSMGEFAKTNYENAITRDNLLSMLHPRLMLAKQLLTDDGVIFCSIDDKNQAYIKGLFDEVFGEECFITNFIWQKKVRPSNKKLDKANNVSLGISSNTEYILLYSKNQNITFTTRKLDADYVKKNYKNPDNDPNGLYTTKPLWANSNSNSECERILPDGTKLVKKWFISQETLDELFASNAIYFGKDGFRQKVYLSSVQGQAQMNLLLGDEMGTSDAGTALLKEILDDAIFMNPKPVALIKHFVQLCTSSNATVLDFYAGSGTTGQAVLELNEEDGGNRTFILCTNNETTDTTPNGIAVDVTSERLRRVMTGETSEGTSDFDWIKKNKPLGGTLEVYDIASVPNFENKPEKTAFDVIDETLYGESKFEDIKDKAEWVCSNFEHTQKYFKPVQGE